MNNAEGTFPPPIIAAARVGGNAAVAQARGGLKWADYYLLLLLWSGPAIAAACGSRLLACDWQTFYYNCCLSAIRPRLVPKTSLHSICHIKFLDTCMEH